MKNRNKKRKARIIRRADAQSNMWVWCRNCWTKFSKTKFDYKNDNHHACVYQGPPDTPDVQAYLSAYKKREEICL